MSKRVFSTILTILIFIMNGMPSFAITSKTTKEKLKKEQTIEYINLEWWKEYNDEYLTDYILKALENNNDLKIATLKVENARQLVKLQMGEELPSVGIDALPFVAKLPTQSNTVGVFAMPIVANYEADIFLKNHTKTKSMKKIYEASKMQEKATYLAIISTVGATYYNIVKVDELIDLQEQIINDRKIVFELMKKRNEKGITSVSDLTQAEKRYVLSTTELINLKKTRENLLTSFCVLIGESPENINKIKRISYKDLKNRKNIPVQISSDVIFSRPDYKASEIMVQKAGLDIKVAQKEFLPTFNIGGLIAPLTTTSSLINSMNWETALAGAGVNAFLPLFTGGKRIANLKIKKNKYEQVLEEYQKTNLTCVKEVNDSLAYLKLDHENYLKNLQAYQLEQKDFKLMNSRYNKGVVSYLDLTQKEDMLLTLQKLKTASDIDEYIAQISLYKTTAGAKI